MHPLQSRQGFVESKILVRRAVVFSHGTVSLGLVEKLKLGNLEMPCLYYEWAAIQHSANIAPPSIDDMYRNNACSSPRQSQHRMNFQDEEDSGFDTTEDMEDFLRRSNMHVEKEDSA